MTILRRIINFFIHIALYWKLNIHCTGHRFKTTHDFGFVALDVLYVYAEDSGEYTARAVNDYGEDMTKTNLKVKGKISSFFLEIFNIYSLNQWNMIAWIYLKYFLQPKDC